MRTSDQINEIATALAKAQAAMKPAVKDAVNPAFRSKYADLTAVWDACRDPLTSHGIAVLQDVETAADGIAVTTRLVHSSGQWVECGPLVIPLAKRDAHGVGSATSYAKRYALSAAVGIVSDDDDGNAAVDGAAPATRPRTAAPPPPRETVNTGTGEITPPAQRAIASGHGDMLTISDSQRKRLWAIAKKAGGSDDEIKAFLLNGYGFTSTKDVTRARYDEICSRLIAIGAGGDAWASTTST